jgi:hypothetical protein
MTDKKEWRCFHCDEVFTDRREAALHFGVSEDQEPLCVIFTSVEKDIWKVVREAEDRAAEAYHQLHEESSDAHRAYRNLHYRYHEAVTLAEQRGYEKGLNDHLATIMGLVHATPGMRIVVRPEDLEDLPNHVLTRYGDSKTPGEVYELTRKPE